MCSNRRQWCFLQERGRLTDTIEGMAEAWWSKVRYRRRRIEKEVEVHGMRCDRGHGNDDDRDVEEWQKQNWQDAVSGLLEQDASYSHSSDSSEASKEVHYGW